MAHFAHLDIDNTVTQVIVVANEVLLDSQGNEAEQLGIDFCSTLLGSNWVQTSYNGSFRKNYAGTGFTYDVVRDAFISPQPFDSWILNEDTCQWESPVPHPTDTTIYRWDEEITNWIEVA